MVELRRSFTGPVASFLHLCSLLPQQEVQKFSDNDKLYLYLQLPSGPSVGEKRYFGGSVYMSQVLILSLTVLSQKVGDEDEEAGGMAQGLSTLAALGRGPGLCSQYPHGGSQPSITLSFWKSDTTL
jgi:hypothetical protein